MKWEVDILVSYPTTVEVEAATRDQAVELAFKGQGREIGINYSEADVVDVRQMPEAASE